MIKINRCIDTECLTLSFQYLGDALTLRTTHRDSKANRKIVRALARQIAADLISGNFNIDDYLSAHLKAEVIHRLPLTRPLIPTFASYVDNWINSHCAYFSPATLTIVRRMLERYLLPTLGMLEVNKISEHELLQLRLSLCQRLFNDNIMSSAVKLNNVFRLATKILTDASAAYGFMPPAKPPLITGRKQDVDPFTSLEVHTLLQHVPVILLELFQFMLYSGMQLSEICALQWSDVDFERGFIRVRHVMVNSRMHLLRKPKRMREVNLTEPIRQALRRQQFKTSHLNWVFSNDSRRPISAKVIASRVWPRALKHSGVRTRSVRQCLWTAALSLFTNGASVPYVASQLGLINWRSLFVLQQSALLSGQHSQTLDMPFLTHLNDDSQ